MRVISFKLFENLTENNIPHLYVSPFSRQYAEDSNHITMPELKSHKIMFPMNDLIAINTVRCRDFFS